MPAHSQSHGPKRTMVLLSPKKLGCVWGALCTHCLYTWDCFTLNHTIFASVLLSYRLFVSIVYVLRANPAYSAHTALCECIKSESSPPLISSLLHLSGSTLPPSDLTRWNNTLSHRASVLKPVVRSTTWPHCQGNTWDGIFHCNLEGVCPDPHSLTSWANKDKCLT